MQKSISANRKNEKQSLSLAEFFLLEVFSNVYFGEERFSFKTFHIFFVQRRKQGQSEQM